MNPLKLIKKLKAYIRMQRAISMADTAHEKDFDRYYVVGSPSKKLIIVNRQNFRLLKRKHYIHQSTTMQDVKKGCYYYTAGRLNNDPISPEEKSFRLKKYYHWFLHK